MRKIIGNSLNECPEMVDNVADGKVDRAGFFPRVRSSVFRGVLNQGQVDGLNDVLDAYELYFAKRDPRVLAYILATVFHETDQSMQPVREYGRGHGLAYGRPVNGQVYYGRGYVQLTWLKNYQAMSPIAGVDLVANPDEALRHDVAAKILFYGMEHGTFTGHKLADYITPTHSDYVNARRIVNGTDKAALIASYARNFLSSIGELI